MPYVDYNLSLYRTGYRPYDLTNPWSAHQLNGYSTESAALSGYLGYFGTGVRPFTPSGGQRLGQIQRGMHPMLLHGLGQAAVCLDQNQNSVPCSDPECTYGDCGSTAAQVTVGALCLDQSQNQVACTDPNCTFGDCSAPAKTPARGVTPAPGPAPRTYAPATMFPQTAPMTSYGQPSILGVSASGLSSTLMMSGLAILAIALLMGGKK